MLVGRFLVEEKNMDKNMMDLGKENVLVSRVYKRNMTVHKIPVRPSIPPKGIQTP